MTMICIAVLALTVLAAGATVFLHRRADREWETGKRLLVGGAFAVLLAAETFLLCFALDSGIMPVLIVCIVSFAVLYAALTIVGSTADGKRREHGKPTLGVNTTKTKRFLLSSTSVALSLVAVILVNLICTDLSDRFGWTLDLTESRMYSISQDSDEVLHGLDNEVTMTVLMSEESMEQNQYGGYVHTLMKQYDAASDQLSIRYIDPYQNPGAVDEYSALSDDVAEGSIIVQSGDRSRVLNLIDFYDTTADSTSGYTYVSAFRGENTLTSALLAVTSEDTPQAVLLQGHNESVSDAFRDLLETAGYAVSECNLTETDLPDNAALLILSLPQTDWEERELDALDDYVKNGGDLLVFTGTDSGADLSNLESYLTEWGITVGHDTVLDADYNLNDARNPLASLADTSFNAALDAKADQVLVTPNAVRLTVGLDGKTSDRTVETILSSRKSSYARAMDSGKTYDSYAKQKSDTDGPFALAAVAEYTGNDSGGQVMVCASALMMSDQLMQSSTLLNQKFLSNTISQMQPSVDLVAIPSKEMSAEPLTISSTMTYAVFLFLLFIPAFLFFYGLLLFLHRRKL